MRRSWIGAALSLSVACGAAWADTLVCADGRRIHGEVVLEGGVYKVNGRFGKFEIPERDVVEWKKGEVVAPPPVAKPPVTSGSAKPRALDDAKKAELIKRYSGDGERALAAGEFETARALLMDVVKAKPDDLRAMHGLALAHVGCDDLAKAAPLIEKAFERATANNKPPDRALLLNFAMVQIALNRQVRAAKVLYDHLVAHAAPLDEEMINALAVALNNADAKTKDTPLFAKMADFYVERNKELEATRRDKRRWGTRWVSHGEFATLDAEWKRTQAIADRHWDSKVATAANRARTAARDVNTMNMRFDMTAAQKARARRDYDAAMADYAEALAGWRELMQQVKRPEFPTAIATVPVDASEPPKVASAFAEDAEAMAITQRRAEALARATASSNPRPPVQPVRPPLQPPVKPADPAGKPAEPGPVAQAIPEPPKIVTKKAAGKRTAMRYGAAIPVGPDLFVAALPTVNKAQEIVLTSLNGDNLNAKVIRADEAAGIALLRVDGAKVNFLKIADGVKAGPVQCVSLSSGIFEAAADTIDGTIRLAAGTDVPQVSLRRLPRRVGSPVVSANMVVALLLADHGSDPGSLRVVSARSIRDLCGQDLPAGAGSTTFGLPGENIYEVTASVEVE